MVENNNEAFRVIIVGAGISGLLLANILARANIDFVVLEARSQIARPAGGSFDIWPNGARILDQIGCWDEIGRACEPLVAYDIRRADGSSLVTSDIPARMRLEY